MTDRPNYVQPIPGFPPRLDKRQPRRRSFFAAIAWSLMLLTLAALYLAMAPKI